MVNFCTLPHPLDHPERMTTERTTMHTPQTTGPGDGVEPIGLVRRRDPSTSWEAASAQTVGKRASLQRTIYRLLNGYPMTHEGLVARLPLASPSGVRSRCAELVAAGWVVDSGERRRTSAGSPSIVWRVATDADPVPEPDDGWKKPVERRLEAARERAEWEAGDRRIADIVLRAYLNPGRDARELAAEQGLDR